jgi:adhesin transport system membrane fusion protein
MLNLSPTNKNQLPREDFWALKSVIKEKSSKKIVRVFYVFFFLAVVFMFIPWTQNVRSNGKLITLRPEQRPQTINTIIAGRIEKWYVKDGDIVKKGDTLLFISEVKDGYFDPKLIERTKDQIRVKEQSVRTYGDKVVSLDNRIDALIESGKLKLQQAQIKLKQTRLKLISDSIDYQVARNNYDIAKDQFERFEKLTKEGLKSQTDLEIRKVSMQRAQGSMISAQQKLSQSRNDIIDAKVELSSIEAKYRDEISKAESDKFSAMTSMFETEVDVTKLQTQSANYSIRNGMYVITAPQDGVVTKVIQSGIGETVKQGEEVLTIMPRVYDLAVEMYIRPMDLPLIQKGQKVRIQFDGWPAIVFSGWPNTSHGTYGGEVFAVDNFAQEDGTFRVLISPDKNDYKWPNELRVGGGTNSMILLKDVPVWYELWRIINGFPPDFYKKSDVKANKGKK